MGDARPDRWVINNHPLKFFDALPLMFLCRHFWNSPGQHHLVLNVINQNRVKRISASYTFQFSANLSRVNRWSSSKSSSTLLTVLSINDGLPLHSLSWPIRRTAKNFPHHFRTFFTFVHMGHFILLTMNFKQTDQISGSKNFTLTGIYNWRWR